MSRRNRVILGILIFLAVGLVALVVVVPLLFDLDRYRPQVTALIEQQTGKPAEIGHLALSFFPRLSIRVDNFGLRNPAGFPQGYFVKARRIHAVVDAGGLWNHQVVIKSLDLETPAISLLSDLKGTWNFATIALSTTGSSNAPAPDPPGEKPLFTLGAISNVKISKGELNVATLLPSGQPGPAFFQAEGLSSELRQFDLNALAESAAIPPAAEPATNSRASWFTTVAYAGDQNARLVAEGSLKIDGLHVMSLVVTKVNSRLRLFASQAFFDDLEYKCYDGGGEGNLSFAFKGPHPRYSAHTKLSGVNVAKLLEAFPAARGKMTGTLNGNVGLDGEMSRSPDPLAGIGGSGQMSIRNGRLPTLQLDKNLLELVRVAKMGPAAGDPASFSSIALDFTIANNRVSTSKATIVGNGIEMDIFGSLGLAGKGSLDYQGVARVATSQNALTDILGNLSGAKITNGKMALSFSLTGTLQNPTFTLKSGSVGSQRGTNKGVKP